MESAAAMVQRLACKLDAQLVETHISWVLLADRLAYKLKKPVRLPFVDYSTPELRRHFCEEEVRLNRRLAPSLYLGVSRVTGSMEDPSIDGTGATLDHAVRMRRFPAGALFSERAEAGTLDAAAVDRFAHRLADFHASAPPIPTAPAQDLEQRTLAALDGCRSLLDPVEHEALQAWIRREGQRLAGFWQARRAAGCVREGHGDLHLANVVEIEGEIAAFDCIEFDADLRCVDLMQEIAFPFMDFAARGQAGLGWRFLASWLERTGDYEGVAGLRPCLVYRALVRASVEHLRQPRSAAALGYANEALAWSRPPQPRLFITHGLPGSGKTFQSQRLLEGHGAIRIRSDVERKRLHGLAALASSAAAGIQIYTAEATRRTYARLFALAGPLLRAGWSVVLDAAFLKWEERDQARALAEATGVPFAILACEAPADVLCSRLATRRADASEADVAVLDKLVAAAEPLRMEERAQCCAHF